MANYDKIACTKEFVELKRSKMKFIWPIVILFFCLYLSFPLMAAYAKPLMSKFLFGNITFGYLFGVSLYFVAWALAFVYFLKAKGFDQKAKALVEKYRHQKGA
ncbi:DUF485 domain-containing protein [Siminovitchia sp. FSL H7-0308]|uniref:Uncharacterized membrane protein (DUF485 family) n=1 Tax=Siminovitchia thermophila TaxID=1245522 RepID=A0ABS2RF16_9BACI|nr:DUF485 domain-containing protein [Siminovitchia thermophila]MBM7717463.1 uncharacterized membrane protein (DUF485 family) [Siminovitchia thermophila]ONK22317.1 hypothetical protein BLX87_16825 [Bacillus sp. VT-16-64]